MQCFCVCVRCESIPIHEPCESCFVAWLFSRSHSSDLFPFLFRSLFSPFLVFSLAKWSEAWRQFYAFHSLLFPIALSLSLHSSFLFLFGPLLFRVIRAWLQHCDVFQWLFHCSIALRVLYSVCESMWEERSAHFPISLPLSFCFPLKVETINQSLKQEMRKKNVPKLRWAHEKL